MNKGKKVIKYLLLSIITIVFVLIINSKSYAAEIKSIKDLRLEVNTSVHTYDGEERRATVKIYDGNKKLKEGKHYTLTYKNATNPGKATVIIEGIGNYKGKIIKNYYIAPQKAKINNVTFNAKFTNATIEWEKIDNASGYRIYMSETENGEYEYIRTVVGTDNTSYTKKGLNPDKIYYFKVRAYTQYGDKKLCKKFSNAKANTGLSIKKLDVQINTEPYTYDGGERNAKVKIYNQNKKIQENIDYIVNYENNINPGKATVTIEGIGRYKGKITKNYYIAPQRAKINNVTFNAKFTNATINWEKVDNASGYKIYMSETKDGEYEYIRTIAGEDTTSYTKKGLNPDKIYYFKIRAYKQYGNKKICKKFSNAKANSGLSIKKLDVQVNTDTYTYDGGERRAKVRIYNGNKRILEGRDYTLTYFNDINPGKATVTIQGTGRYKGTITKHYYIAPQRAKINNVTFNTNFTRATIDWDRIDNARGYSIYMSETRDGEYYWIKTIDNNYETSYTKYGLNPDIMYYFKVRAYAQYGDKKIAKKFSDPKSNTGLVSSVSLYSPTSGPNRNYNLSKACQIINGKIIRPGETFNWFRDHGPASAARGFRLATVYQGTLSVPGYGGGVCQVSTTIYQAARNIGLYMVERHVHSKPVSYTTVGNDATVSYGYDNLIIRNNKSYTIKLVLYANGGRTTCQIYRVEE